MCKKGTYFDNKVESKTHLRTVHGLKDLKGPDEVLRDMPREGVADGHNYGTRLMNYCIEKEYISSECILCDDDFTNKGLPYVYEHYAFVHQLHDIIYESDLPGKKAAEEAEGEKYEIDLGTKWKRAKVQKILTAQPENSKHRDLKVFPSIESLLSTVYDIRYNEEAVAVSSEACRDVATKFINSGFSWDWTTKPDYFAENMDDHGIESPTFEHSLVKRVTGGKVYLYNGDQFTGGQPSKRLLRASMLRAWEIETDSAHVADNEAVAQGLKQIPRINWLDHYRRVEAPFEQLIEKHVPKGPSSTDKPTREGVLSFPPLLLERWMKKFWSIKLKQQ